MKPDGRASPGQTPCVSRRGAGLTADAKTMPAAGDRPTPARPNPEIILKAVTDTWSVTGSAEAATIRVSRRRAVPAGPALADSLRPRGPVHLELFEEHRPGETLVQAAGEIDLLTAAKLARSLDSILRTRDGDVVLDLSETVFIDSAALHVLLNAQRRLTRRSRGLRVICPEGPVRRVIELARLLETLGVVTPGREE